MCASSVWIIQVGNGYGFPLRMLLVCMLILLYGQCQWAWLSCVNDPRRHDSPMIYNLPVITFFSGARFSLIVWSTLLDLISIGWVFKCTCCHQCLFAGDLHRLTLARTNLSCSKMLKVHKITVHLYTYLVVYTIQPNIYVFILVK